MTYLSAHKCSGFETRLQHASNRIFTFKNHLVANKQKR